MTSRYVSGDTARLTEASAAFAEMLSRHSQPGTGELSMERAMGFEPTTFSLEGQADAIAKHLTECPTCMRHVTACLKWTEGGAAGGTGEPAQAVTVKRLA